MRTVLLASLRTHTRRYVAAVLAVVVGVSFVVTTDALASATRAGLLAGIDAPWAGADAVVSDLSGADAAALVDEAEQRGDAVSVLARTYQRVSSSRGRLPARADVGVVADDPALRWQQLVAGRFADGPGEAVLDADQARAAGLGLGDPLRIGSGADALDTRVVGLVDDAPAGAGSAVYLGWQDALRFAPALVVDSLAWAGASPATVRALPAVVAADATVSAPAPFVQERATQLSQGVDVVSSVLLLFAAIALFVSVLVIANTFSILLAQRSRDLALLRCVGATRRQVLRSVRAEALLVGTVASGLGLAVGAGLGHALVALAGRVSDDAPLGAVDLSARWLVGAFAVGVLVTLVASWLPTRRVTDVDPVAALRPAEQVEVASPAGRARLGLGVALVAVGCVLLGAAVALVQPLVMVGGGFAVFGGVLLLGPVLVPALVRAAGAVLAPVGGTTTRLATANAVRNPRRTAATTASLLVGVTLTTAVLTGLASSRGALDDEMTTQHPVDVLLTAADDPLDDGTRAAVQGTAGVRAAVALPGVRAEGSDDVGPVTVVAAPRPVDLGDVLRGAAPAPGPREVLLPLDLVPASGVVTLTAGGRTVRLRATGAEGWGDAAVVAPGTLARLTGAPATAAIWVRAEDGADADALDADLSAVARASGADVASGLAQRAYVDLQLDVLTAAVVALLAIAVVIALVGIANTLGLSVLERGREHALLRALGLTRRQLRSMLAAEAVLLSVVATLLGTALGVGFAWVGVLTLVAPVLDAPLVMPWGQLLLVVAVAGAAGLLSCVLPARRAGRVSPAAGLALE